METLPSVLDDEDGKIRDKMEQFHFVGNTPPLMDAQSFHRLKFNDSIKIRMKHKHYKYMFLSRRDCVITFSFLDEKESEIFRFIVIPGAAEFQLVCANQDPIIGTFSDNDYEKYYEFVLIFSNVGIMLFYMDEFNIKATHCVNRITDISKFRHTAKETTDFEAMMEVRSENVRIPGDWHVVKHIPMDHKISIRYYPDVQSIITVRLTDRNGIVALTVTIDYKTGILFTKRDRYDEENVPCVNFGSDKQFSAQMLGRIEIGIYAHRYKIGMRMNKGGKMMECTTFGHYYSPYDIEQTIFDSTNMNMIAYVHHLQSD